MTGHQIVGEARGWLGTPYVHQASVKGVGCDCLGLVRGVWRAVIGPEPERLPAYTQDWSEASGREVLLAAAQRWLRPATGGLAIGDVVLFRMRDGAVSKHLGIVASLGASPTLIHAYCGHGVVESPFGAAWTRRQTARFTFPKVE